MQKTGLILTHLVPSDYAAQPWKNGKGATREIARAEGEPFAWRLSLASTPRSGPFSVFPEYDRSLTVLSGGPITLSHDGGPAQPVALFSPYGFKGGAATVAEVHAPAEDLNLLTHRDQARGAVYVSRFIAGEQVQFPVQRNVHFLFCAQGRIDVFDPNSGMGMALTAGDTLRLQRDSPQEFLNLQTVSPAPAVALWIVIQLQVSKQASGL